MESLQQYSLKIREIGEQPRSLRDFADYCDVVNSAREDMRAMEERAMQVTRGRHDREIARSRRDLGA